MLCNFIVFTVVDYASALAVGAEETCCGLTRADGLLLECSPQHLALKGWQMLLGMWEPRPLHPFHFSSYFCVGVFTAAERTCREITLVIRGSLRTNDTRPELQGTNCTKTQDALSINTSSLHFALNGKKDFRSCHVVYFVFGLFLLYHSVSRMFCINICKVVLRDT